MAENKKWTPEKIETVRECLFKGYKNDTIACIMADTYNMEKPTKKSLDTIINKNGLLEGVPVEMKIKRNGRMVWETKTLVELHQMTKVWNGDYEKIASLLTKKYGVEISKNNLRNIKSHYKKYLEQIDSNEDRQKILNKKDELKIKEKSSADNSSAINQYSENLKKTAKLKNFKLIKGEKYMINTSHNSSKSNGKLKIYKNLEFMYMTEHVLYFRDSMGLVKSFIRNKSLVKIKKMEG